MKKLILFLFIFLFSLNTTFWACTDELTQNEVDTLNNITWNTFDISQWCTQTELNLWSIHFWSSFPNYITKLNNLTHLYIDDNQFTNLPLSFTNLTNLVELNLNDNPALWNLSFFYNTWTIVNKYNPWTPDNQSTLHIIHDGTTISYNLELLPINTNSWTTSTWFINNLFNLYNWNMIIWTWSVFNLYSSWTININTWSSSNNNTNYTYSWWLNNIFSQDLDLSTYDEINKNLVEIKILLIIIWFFYLFNTFYFLIQDLLWKK
jgi:hypothetical protein